MGRGRGTFTESGAVAATRSRKPAGRRERCIAGLRRLDVPFIARVGGDVRDELAGKATSPDVDAVVCGVDFDDLRRACREHGRVAPLESNGNLVGVRLTAPWTPAEGVEIALARTETSTGAGHRDFDIVPIPASHFHAMVADGHTPAEAGRRTLLLDLRRRDFTVNAIAADVHTGELIDPYGGAADLRRRVLRVVDEHAFRDDPLRILRGFARVSKDGLRPDAQTFEQMRLWADAIRHLSGERIAGEIEKMLDGEHVADALRLARDTGALPVISPELEALIGFRQGSRYHQLTADEHTFEVVRHAVQRNLPLPVKLAALFHDSGKPESAFVGRDGHLHFYDNPDDPGQRPHQLIGAQKAAAAFRRWKHFPQDVTRRAVHLVEHHMFQDADRFDDVSESRRGIRARRFLARHGMEAAEQLIALRWCDLAGKNAAGDVSDSDRRHLAAFEAEIRRQFRASQKHDANGMPRVALDRAGLAVDGRDLRALGFQGREIGQALHVMLHGSASTDALEFPGVIVSPQLNTRDRLLTWAERHVRRLRQRR